MKMRLWIVGMLLTTLLISAGCRQDTKNAQQQAVELNVAAAMGLKDSLLEIQKLYEAKYPNTKLVFNFAASGALQKQIEQGAPADVFISAAVQQVDGLAAKNMIQPDSRKNIVSDRLVLIVPRDSALELQSFGDLQGAAVKQFGIGAPESVPAGEYARQALTKMGIWNEVKEKAVLGKDIHTIVSHVETGNVDAGIVFASTSVHNNKVKIVAEAPPGTHEPVVFPGVVLAGSKQEKEARQFLDFLTSPEAAKVFEARGFTMLK